MTCEELWQLFPIIISEPDPAWEGQFAREKERLDRLKTLKGAAIHHIGSTAVRGIAAKPTVDILIELGDGADIKAVCDELAENGYICWSATADRASLGKGYTPDGFTDEVFHVHLRRRGDNDEVYFRDFLNAHPEEAAAYEKLKRELAVKYRHDRDAYTEAKGDFVRRITLLAKKGR